MARQLRKSDPYLEKLAKLIPGEIIAAYLVLQGLMSGMSQEIIWGVIGVLCILTPFYLLKLGGVEKVGQAIFSAFTFLVWVYRIAPEEILGPIYNPQLAAIILVLWTLIIPLVVPNDEGTTTGA